MNTMKIINTIIKNMKYNFILIYFSSFSLLAVDIPINISGTIMIPPCSINENKKIFFSFNSVQIDSVDGNNNSITKSIPIYCEYYKGKPYISIMGEKLHGAPENILKTKGDTGLGIGLYQGGSVNPMYPILIGDNTNGKKNEIINGLNGYGESHGIMTITAVPYATKSTKLSPGKFDATAKIIITYN